MKILLVMPPTISDLKNIGSYKSSIKFGLFSYGR